MDFELKDLRTALLAARGGPSLLTGEGGSVKPGRVRGLREIPPHPALRATFSHEGRRKARPRRWP